MDDKKLLVETFQNKIIKYRTLLEEALYAMESEEEVLVRALSERLKLSEKFVRTSQF